MTSKEESISNNDEYDEKVFDVNCSNEHSIHNILEMIKDNPSFVPIRDIKFGESCVKITTKRMKYKTLYDAIEPCQDENLTDMQKSIIIIRIALVIQHLHINDTYIGNLTLKDIFLDEKLNPLISFDSLLSSADDKIKSYKKQNEMMTQDIHSFLYIFYNLKVNQKQSENETVLPDLSLLNEWQRKFIRMFWFKMFVFTDVFARIIIRLIKKFNQEFEKIDKADINMYIDDIVLYRKNYSEQIKLKVNNGNDKDLIYKYGRILNENYCDDINKESIIYIKRAAKMGQIDAMFDYALWTMYEKVNDPGAIEYVKIAADNGKVEAMKLLGSWLMKGDRIDKNETEASRYFKILADNGDAIGITEYGRLLNKGIGIPQNKQESIKYNKKAADLGEPLGMLRYAIALDKGDGIDADQKEALRYYKMAADNDCVLAMKIYALILMMSNIQDEISQKFKGMSNIGKDIQRNKHEAAIYFKKAADKGDSYSNYQFGKILFDGDGIQQNKQEAASYLKKSADLGERESMIFFGKMNEKGDGIPINNDEVIKYYQMARDNNSIEAEQYMKRIIHCFAKSF